MTDRKPAVFGIPPGADFPAELVAGLRERMSDRPSEAMARVQLYLNSGRMLREVREAFAKGPPGYLPSLRLLPDLGADPLPDLPAAVPPLRRRLQIARLVARLLDAQPDLAPRSAVYDLADSLMLLLDEMQDEGVEPDALAALDVSDLSAHWKRTQDFLAIVAPFFLSGDAPDAATRRRLAVEAHAERWRTAPPGHPVIVAGSTGSRGTTAMFMRAVAALPDGMLVLPGFDTELPTEVWDGLDDAMTAEDHPQFRYRRLMDALSLSPLQIRSWTARPAPQQGLNRLISLSLRPAPVTDHWLTEGPGLPDLTEATDHVCLIEAAGPRAEALAIATVLREAVESGVEAALISPDRVLTRRVTAALDRWGIQPDDSAGRPLGLSAPGRLLRQVASLFGRKLTGEDLLAVLKHPLVASGSDRGIHLRLTRDLELHLRRHGPAFPSPANVIDWGASQRDPAAVGWAAWLAGVLVAVEDAHALPLPQMVTRHVDVTVLLACGHEGTGAGGLWEREAGEAALAAVEALLAEAAHGDAMTPADYAAFVAAHLSRQDVREAVQGHPLVRILGPREARECRAELVVLAGLNDGSWPQLPSPDPWLNRQMRQAAGLLLPERQIGLSAHDYQQAVGRPRIVLSRALRTAEAETVPSRWINRLLNLMSGLPERGGPEAIRAMRERGQRWLALASTLDEPFGPMHPAPRPAPRPPVEHRPAELAVTGISKLIRDPYAIYARHILRLYPLDPLRAEPDALKRGSILHDILERFVRDGGTDNPATAETRLLAIADEVLAAEVPWPSARLLWRARLERAAPAFLQREAASGGTPVILERKGSIELPTVGFRLTARPDRIDELADGRLHILDYKTGTPPSAKQQKAFDKQLLLEAAMAERGAFETIGPRDVARITYVGLNAAASISTTEITPEITEAVWHELHALIGRYGKRSQGYTSRRAVFAERFAGDYDHLARFGEWDMTDPGQPEDVG